MMEWTGTQVIACPVLQTLAIDRFVNAIPLAGTALETASWQLEFGW